MVWLVEPAIDHPTTQLFPYAALSYTWVGEQTLRLEKKTELCLKQDDDDDRAKENNATTQTSVKGPFNDLPPSRSTPNNSLSVDRSKASSTSHRSPFTPVTIVVMEVAVAEWLEGNTNDDLTAHIK
ncbi:hypothetical protein HYE67_000068 [Fusarium culmorum]|uniref:Uncharacterized protein n=1 Tax=Fusarium culmorum TaxID=5516 RepID=A0A7S8HQW3_FUSCU|nr:hypothetical protein HYE67_000068 [Fusarium culmorum]